MTSDRSAAGDKSLPDPSSASDSPESADAPVESRALPSAERSIAQAGPSSDRYLGCTIDNRYKVEGIIGEGGMGVVYQCRHKIIDKRVALKILRADVAQEAEVTERFLMEAKAASAIHNEHIISISDFGQLPDGAAYFVMEFLDGTPLSELAAGGNSIPVLRILSIAIQLTDGLSAAHKRGIVHRDLKPDNVILIQRGKQSDFVKILDFGIAKVNKNTDNRLTQAGSVFGTPHYMSPEQAAGTPLDHRSDVYSLGIILYELATGSVPFDAENFVGILSQQLYEEPLPLSQAPGGAHLPKAFETLVLKCLAKGPENRFQSMLELRDELLALQRTLSPEQGSSINSPQSSEAEAASIEGAALSARLTPAQTQARRWPLYVAIAAPMSVVLVIFGAQIGANQAHLADRAAVLAAAEHQSTPAAQQVRQVLLGVTPSNSHVVVQGKDMGLSPVSVAVPFGKQVEVELHHPDYSSRHLILDGSEERLTIDLVPLQQPVTQAIPNLPSRSLSKPSRKRRSSSTRGQKNSPTGGGLLVKPWAD